MKVLVTGAEGFIGKNLVHHLVAAAPTSGTIVMEFDRTSPPESLTEYCARADFVFHLAGVNRPQDDVEFNVGNVDLTRTVIEALRDRNPGCPILLASSVQAALDNPYGQSKRQAEDVVLGYGRETDARTYVYRLPGVFGKWSRPNYNTVVATICHNVARGLPVDIHDPSTRLTLAYIDDVVDEFIRAMTGTATPSEAGLYAVPIIHDVSLDDIMRLVLEFRRSRTDLTVPDMGTAFVRKLYATYLSFLPTEGFSYPLVSHVDERGSFTEVIRTPERGQFSVNIVQPGVTKGNHWHHTKNEKFLVIAGEGLIQFRGVGSDKVIEYQVSGDRLEVVDIPPGYTHSITNVGEREMTVLMWASENYDPDRPDTHWLEVRTLR